MINQTSKIALTQEQLQMLEHQRMMALQKMIIESENYACEGCGCMVFESVSIIKKISGLATGTGKDSLAVIPMNGCKSCGKIPKYFMDKLSAEETTEEEESKKSILEI